MAIKESYPLSWPDGWPRTRPQDRREQRQWKKSISHYHAALAKELGRMGVSNFVISSNVPLNARGVLVSGPEPLDPGVSVWFSRKGERDFAWQDVLDIHDPVPTEEQINRAYQQRAKLYHTDRGGGDLEMFIELTKQRDNALRYINRKTDQQFDFVIACDAFEQVRHNLYAIVGTIQSIRKIERCGTSALLERAFKGFSALPEHAQEASHVVTTPAR